MNFAASALIAVVAALHIYFLVLEMFLWTTPKGLKTFRMTPEQAEATAPLAANQGLYNGFLAAGLIAASGCASDGEEPSPAWGAGSGASGGATATGFGCALSFSSEVSEGGRSGSPSRSSICATRDSLALPGFASGPA